MEAKLFKDLNKIQAEAPEVGSKLSKVLLKHANKAQANQLLAVFPELYRETRAGTVTARRKATAGAAVSGSSDGSGQITRELECDIGGYGHQAAAMQDAMQLKHPNVFQYRTDLFPTPKSHGVEVVIKKALPKELAEPSNPLNPWGIGLTIEVSGAAEAVSSWQRKFEGLVRLRQM